MKKKSRLYFWTIVLVVMLVGCNTVSKSSKDKSAQANQNETIENVLKKVSDRQSNQKSFSTALDTKVEITSTNQKNKGASSDNQVKATIDKEADRIYFKQTSEKKENQSDKGTTFEGEVYFVDDEIYSRLLSEQNWQKMNGQEAILAKSKITFLLYMGEYVKQLENPKNSFEMEYKDNQYVLTLKKPSDDFIRFLGDYVNNQLEVGELYTFESSSMRFKNDLKFFVTVDSSTFDIKNITLKTTVNGKVDNITEETIEISSRASYSDFDKTEAIEVPQEAKSK